MIPVIVLLAQLAATPSAARSFPFEIASNKPFVQVAIDGSAPQWFILDTGCSGPSIVAKECADRLKLGRGAESRSKRARALAPTWTSPRRAGR
jgi:hypothetical protein